MQRRDMLRDGALAVCGLALPAMSMAAEQCSHPNQFGFLACETGIPSIALMEAQRSQNQSQWCWAACIAMCAKYYGYSLSQKKIVQEVYGRLVNLPAVNWTLVAALSRDWEDDDGNQFSSRCDVIWDLAMGNVRSDAPQLATQYLSQNIPLIVGTLGHAMVLTDIGFFRHAQNPYVGGVNFAIVRDPWPLNPRRRILSPQEWNSIQFLAAVRMS
jgi:hypothetical protein